MFRCKKIIWRKIQEKGNNVFKKGGKCYRGKITKNRGDWCPKEDKSSSGNTKESIQGK